MSGAALCLLTVSAINTEKLFTSEATTRRDQSSIFGGKILGLHFQTLSLILLLIGKAFTDTDTRLIWKRINTPAAINRYQPNKSFQMESLWPHILKLDRAESLNLNWLVLLQHPSPQL